MTFANDHRAVIVQEGFHRDGDTQGLPGKHYYLAFTLLLSHHHVTSSSPLPVYV